MEKTRIKVNNLSRFKTNIMFERVVFAEPRYMASGAELNGENHILFEQQNKGK